MEQTMPIIVEEKSFINDVAYDEFFEGYNTVETEKLTYYVEKEIESPDILLLL